MVTVGSYQVKAQLPQLLNRVENGEKITITKRGKPAAMLVPPLPTAGRDIRQVVREMLCFRNEEGPRLGSKLTIRELIEEGRRCEAGVGGGVCRIEKLGRAVKPG